MGHMCVPVISFHSAALAGCKSVMDRHRYHDTVLNIYHNSCHCWCFWPGMSQSRKIFAFVACEY